MKKLLIAASFGVSALALQSGTALAADPAFTLNILHINDLHSRIESINRFDSTCSAEDETKNECFGGVARIKTALDQRRAALNGENVLTLNAGDNFQGSLFYSTYKGDTEAEFTEMMDFDAMVIGNHEFDDGDEGLAKFADKVSYPIISGNVLIGANSAVAGKTEEYVIIEVGGEKIGIIGALASDTDETSSPSDAILFLDEIEYLKTASAALTEQGVNKIIALTHVGYALDIEIARQVPGIDLVVGGHSHTLLDRYPTYGFNVDGNIVPVVQAYAYGKYLGEIAVNFDADGNVIDAKGAPILLDSSIMPDAAVLARVQELGGPIEELKGQRVGETSANIDGSRDTCRAQECEMGNLVADAMLDRVKGQGIDVAIQNGGGLRASIEAGEVTMGDVLTVLPFQNTLATFQLTGAGIVAALENGVGRIEDGAGRFPQVSGMSYGFDIEKPAGERVHSVMVGGAAIDLEKTYGVATNNYMRGGGDGYDIFETDGMNAYDFGPGLEEVVATYIAAKGSYTPMLDGRITAGPAAMATDAAATMEAKPEAVETAPAVPEAKPEMAKEEPKAEAAMMDKKMHTIVAGDNYWDLAKTFYGDASKWTMLEEANPSLNPNDLTIGAEMMVPAAQ